MTGAGRAGATSEGGSVTMSMTLLIGLSRDASPISDKAVVTARSAEGTHSMGTAVSEGRSGTHLAMVAFAAWVRKNGRINSERQQLTASSSEGRMHLRSCREVTIAAGKTGTRAF